eukprot:15149064-Ditylum_brightwellii.AAC.1
MQNVQRLTGTGRCSKYICKYIANIDEQNYVVIEKWARIKIERSTTKLLKDVALVIWKCFMSC